jgi:uncharacterized protein YwbE
MAAKVVNFTIEQGATFEHQVLWREEDTTTPVSLTGYTARMHIREKLSSTEIMLALTSEPDGGITLGGLAGTVDIFITDDQTAALTRGGVYDLEVERSSDGYVVRLIQGTISLSKEVTR